MTDKLKITIEVAGRRYKLTVNRDLEETYRKAAKIINEQIAYYRGKQDIQESDVLTMAAFRVALAYVAVQSENNKNSLAIAEICKEIEDALLSD